MARFKIITSELTTYVHYIEVPDDVADPEDWVYENFDSSHEGEEVKHDFQIDEVEEVK